MVRNDFETWEKINLSGMPDWPALNSDGEAKFIKDLARCQFLGSVITVFTKGVADIKKLMKAEKIPVTLVKSADGARYETVASEGISKKIIRVSDGEQVKVATIAREVKRFRLNTNVAKKIEDCYGQWVEYIEPIIVKSGKDKGQTKKNTGVYLLKTDKYSRLPEYVAELESLRDEYKNLYGSVRPYEMGLIERAKNGESHLLNNQVEIEVNTDKERDDIPEIAEKLQSGEYVKKNVPFMGSKWVLTPAPVAVTV